MAIPAHTLNGKPVEVDTTVGLIYSLVEHVDLVMLAPNTIDPVLRADFMKLMELTSSDERSARAARKAVEGMWPTMPRNISDKTQRQKFIDPDEDKLRAIFKTETFREEMITVYANYFKVTSESIDCVPPDRRDLNSTAARPDSRRT